MAPASTIILMNVTLSISTDEAAHLTFLHIKESDAEASSFVCDQYIKVNFIHKEIAHIFVNV